MLSDKRRPFHITSWTTPHTLTRKYKRKKKTPISRKSQLQKRLPLIRLNPQKDPKTIQRAQNPTSMKIILRHQSKKHRVQKNVCRNRWLESSKAQWVCSNNFWETVICAQIGFVTENRGCFLTISMILICYYEHNLLIFRG